MKIRHCLRLLTYFLLVPAWVLCGCGGGSSSSTTSPPPPSPDFSLALGPSLVNVPPGGLSAPTSLSYAAVNGFNGVVQLTESVPTGISCGPAGCSGSIAEGGSLPVQFAASSSLAPGSYTVSITGTSGSLTHTVALTVAVQPPPTAITPPNLSAVVVGDGRQPLTKTIYDKTHDLIFAVNTNMDEIEVRAGKTLKLQKIIPVPEPMNVDITVDDASVYVGTLTQYFYKIDTATLRVINSIPLPTALGAHNNDVYPLQVTPLADGTLMIVDDWFRAPNIPPAQTLVLYSPTTGTFSVPTLPDAPAVFEATQLFTSTDKQRLLILTGQELTLYLYDVPSKTFTSGKVPGGNVPNGISIKPDGTGFAVGSGCCQILFADWNFNSLGFITDSSLNIRTLFFSPDSSRLFVPESGIAISVFDTSSFKLLGQIPNFPDPNSAPPASPTFFNFDGEQRLLGMTTFGLVAADTNITPSTLDPVSPIIRFDGGVGINSLMVPDNPSTGYQSTLNGAGFDATPVVTFDGYPSTALQVTSTNSILLDPPGFTDNNQADVAVYFPDGYYSIAPRTWNYRPTLLYTDQDGSSTDGGTTLVLYGDGIDIPVSSLSLTIGGVQATNLFSPNLGYITATVPPGTLGNADITLTAPIGNATLKGGFTYVTRTSLALPAGASPFQMVIDKSRGRLLWTDDTSNALVVYSIASNAIVQTVPLGTTPGGLALTPDGSKLLIVLSGSNVLAVYDAASLGPIQQINTPNIINGSSAFPTHIATIADNRAFLLEGSSTFLEVPLYVYDIASNSLTTRTDLAISTEATEAASADGSVAYVGTYIWNASTDSFTPILAVDGVYPALSADGANISVENTTISGDGYTYGSALGSPGSPAIVGIGPYGGCQLLGYQKLNATGSLAYAAGTDCLRILDVHHTNVLKTIATPEAQNTTFVDMATDPDGQAVYILTTTGLSAYAFASSPLSIGEAKVNSGQLTLLGSGFVSGVTVQLDGIAIPAQFVDSQHLTATLPSPFSAAHNITVALPTGETYSLDTALNPSSVTVAISH